MRQATCTFHGSLLTAISELRTLKVTCKAFCHVSCEHPKVKAGWGASAMCKMQTRVLSNNTFTSSMEATSSAQGFVKHEQFLNMLDVGLIPPNKGTTRMHTRPTSSKKTAGVVHKKPAILYTTSRSSPYIRNARMHSS
eukprot:1665917-Amphidinium_carterae.1